MLIITFFILKYRSIYCYIISKFIEQFFMNLYLVNGFLGSGKTTAIACACRQLSAKKIKSGVITNDQGSQQVDSAYLQSLYLPNVQVSDGCFCCRYNDFEQAVKTLSFSAHPEIIFAESVGSCTDLIATVVKPFSLHYHEVKTVISVFADAYLLHSIMKGTSCFIEDAVQYIYKKQLEEADIIVINKIDLLNKNELDYVKEIVITSYPNKKIIYQNSTNENDIRNWMQLLNEFVIPIQRHSLEINYDTYGAGEAMLAWFDQKISIHSNKSIALMIALLLAQTIYNKIYEHGYTIGHLKFFITDHHNKWHKKISYTGGINNNISHDSVPQSNHCEMLINARVQTIPQLLQQLIEQSIEEVNLQTGSRIASHQISSFQPGYPIPVHRL
jgi:G3E family GTPase